MLSFNEYQEQGVPNHNVSIKSNHGKEHKRVVAAEAASAQLKLLS